MLKKATERVLTAIPIFVTSIDGINWAACWQASVYFFAAVIGLVQAMRGIIKLRGCIQCWKEHGKCNKECRGFSK